MGRIRTIKPEFFQHEGLYELEKESGLPIRVAFAGLWTCCDRDGRFKWRPRQLGIQVLPYDNLDFSRVLDALAVRGFIVKYTVADEVFCYVPSWKRHQFVNNRERPSEIPEPPRLQEVDACGTREATVEDACHKEGKGKENISTLSEPGGSDHANGSGVDPDPELFLHALPENKNGGAQAATNRFDAAVEDVCRYFLTVTNKKPALYEFDQARRTKVQGRLRYCMKLAKDGLEGAVSLAKVAIDRFAADPFHNGDNKQGKKYLDLEVLMRNDRKFAYWLDDDNFSEVKR